MRIFALLSLFAAPLLAQPAQGKTQVTWYGHAAFVITTPGGTTLAIDPWINNPANPDKGALEKIAKLDYILVSHGHFDHVGDTIALQKKTNARLVSAFELGAALIGAGLPQQATGFDTRGNAGGTLQLTPEVSVTMVQAVHSSGFQANESSPMVYAGGPLGFVIQIKNGPTIYHTGDTAYFGEMKYIGERYHPDVMLACIGGHFTMDPTDAARAAKDVGAKTLVPMHFGTFPVLTGTPSELKAKLQGRTKMLELKPGQTQSF